MGFHDFYLMIKTKLKGYISIVFEIIAIFVLYFNCIFIFDIITFYLEIVCQVKCISN